MISFNDPPYPSARVPCTHRQTRSLFELVRCQMACHFTHLNKSYKTVPRSIYNFYFYFHNPRVSSLSRERTVLNGGIHLWRRGRAQQAGQGLSTFFISLSLYLPALEQRHESEVLMSPLRCIFHSACVLSLPSRHALTTRRCTC